LYQGRPAEAVTLLESGIKGDLEANKPEWAAVKYAALATAELMLGKKQPAAAAADKAAASTKEDGILFLAARAQIQAGAEQKARAIMQKLSRSLASEPQAYAKLLEGEIALGRGDAREAIKAIQEGQKLLDTWIGRFDLGRAFLAGQAFTEADSEFDACLRRKGEATALFLDVYPTYSFFPPVHYYIGVSQKGIGSPTAAESFQTFLKIKANADRDPLVAEAKKQAR
jgi:tetratricopeptide (TPR) repeat protein